MSDNKLNILINFKKEVSEILSMTMDDPKYQNLNDALRVKGLTVLLEKCQVSLDVENGSLKKNDVVLRAGHNFTAVKKSIFYKLGTINENLNKILSDSHINDPYHLTLLCEIKNAITVVENEMHSLPSGESL